jgi:RimJ/RimL family protein N-acetyltransferase
MRYWFPGPDRSVQQTKQRITLMNDHWRVHGFGDWAVVSKPDRSVIGFGGLHHIADMEEVNVGYAPERAWWRQGLGFKVCRLLLAHGFGQLGLSEIVAVVNPRNVASIPLAQKCGLILQRRFLWMGCERVALAMTREQWGNQ